MDTDGALVTFLLHSVHGVGSIDLFGSWDNFSTAYPMTKDRQQAGHWYGCPNFKNVICHGDPSNCTMPEDRPLKLGATYWYYYKKNGNDEFYDPNEASTNACPLLPGQTVNFLEMPLLESTAFSTPGFALTLDPQDRWTTPKRPEQTRAAKVGSSVSDMSREWWFKQSLGRLHTAVVASVLSESGSPDVSGSARIRNRTLVPGRQIRTSAGPSSPEPTHPKTAAKRALSQHGSLRRPRLNWRPSDSFINPFQAGHGNEPEINVVTPQAFEDEIVDRPTSRPTTWSYTFPPEWSDSIRRPTSMPCPTHVGSLSPQAAGLDRSPTVETGPKTSPAIMAGLPRIERLSLDALRLPSALQLPALETDFAKPIRMPQAVDSAMLLTSESLLKHGSYAESLPLSIGPESIRSATETFSPTTNSPTASPISSGHPEVATMLHRLSLGDSYSEKSTLPPPAPPTRQPPPIPANAKSDSENILTSAMHSSQETIKPTTTSPTTHDIPVPPIPCSPDFPPVSKPRSAGGRVRGMIASIERSKSSAGQSQSGAQEPGAGLKRSKSSRLAALGRAIL